MIENIEECLFGRFDYSYKQCFFFFWYKRGSNVYCMYINTKHT